MLAVLLMTCWEVIAMSRTIAVIRLKKPVTPREVKDLRYILHDEGYEVEINLEQAKMWISKEGE